MIPTLINCGSNTFKVTIPETNGLMISKKEAKKGEDFVATLSVNTDLVDAALPETLKKVTSGNAEILATEYTYTLKADHISADFTIPAVKVTGDIDIQLELDSTFRLKVNETEFTHAASFEDVQFLQQNCTQKAIMEGTSVVITNNSEYSPTMYHSLTEVKNGEATQQYYEKFVEKIINPDGTAKYMSHVRNAKTADFVVEEVTEANFLTPQSLNMLTQHGLHYNDFSFNEETKLYSAQIFILTIEHDLLYKFLDKKVVMYATKQHISTDEPNFFKITYDPITPEIPR